MLLIGAALCGVLIGAPPVRAADGVWTGSSGSWSETGRWSGGTVADGSDAVADFSTLDIATSTTVTLDNPPRTLGTLHFGDTGASDGSWTLTGSNPLTLDVTSGPAVINVVNSSATINVALAGNDGLTIQSTATPGNANAAGSGKLILAGSNTYTGGTFILSGSAQANTASAFSSGAISLGNTAGNSSAALLVGTIGVSIANPVTVVAGNSGTMTLGVNSSLNNVQFTGNITLNNNLTVAASTTATDVLTLSGVISGAGNLGKTGAGTLNLTGSNTMTGTVTVNVGTLKLSGAGGTLANLTALQVLDGATFQLDNTVSNGNRLPMTATILLQGATFSLNGGSEMAGRVTVAAGGLSTIVNTTSGTLTFASSVGSGLTINSGAAVIFSNHGSGTLGSTSKIFIQGQPTGIIRGAFASTLSTDIPTDFAYYSPSTGVILLGDNGNPGGAARGTWTTSSGTQPAETTVATAKNYKTDVGGSITALTANRMIQSLLVTTTSNTTFNLGGATLNVVSGGILKTSSTGSVTIQNGTLTAGGDAAGQLTIYTPGNMSLLAQVSDNGATGGDVSLVKLGNGTLTLSSFANHYSGGTYVYEGRLLVSTGAGALPATTTVTIAAGASLSISGVSPTIAGLNGAGTLTLGTGKLTIDQSSDTIFSGTIASTSGRIEKNGSGVLTLAGASLYTGTTTIHAGTLQFDGTLSAGSGDVTVNAGGTLGGSGTIGRNVTLAEGTIHLTGGNITGTLSISGGEWTGTGTVGGTIAQSSGTFTLASGTLTTGSTLSVSAGTFNVLSGATLGNTGSITVTGSGNLVANGHIAGSVVVGEGGMLKGSGTIGGSVAVSNGGVFLAGNSVGHLTTGDETWGSGANLVFEISDAAGVAGADWDLITINGMLTLDATPTSKINLEFESWALDNMGPGGPLANFDPNGHHSWLWITTSDGVDTGGYDASELFAITLGPEFAGDYPTALSGYFSILLSGNDLLIDYTNLAAVPEPGSLLLGNLAFAGLGWYARRRKLRQRLSA